MHRIVVLFILYFTEHIHVSGSEMVLGPGVQSPCLPHGLEEIDQVEEPDELVNNMFEAYKEQAKSETPEAEHADSLLDVDAHALLGRLFFYIKNHLEKRKTNPEHDINQESHHALAIFQNIDSNEERWTTNKRWWPYRCYNVETIKALDLFLSEVMRPINQNSRANEHELAALLFGLITSLPQFEAYAQNLHATPIDRICSLIQTSENDTIRDVMWTITKMTTVSQVACQAPYERQTFCNLVSVYHDLEGMADDIEQAGSSTGMKKFAFFWFYGQGLLRTCEDSFLSTQFQRETLVPFAQSAVARLNEIISLSSATGRDLEKIRAFIYDFLYTDFTRYAAKGIPQFAWGPQTPFDGHDNKYTKFSSLSRTDVYEKPERDLLLCFRTFIASLVDIENAIVEGAEITEVRALTRLALVWFLHPNFQLESEVVTYNAFLEGLNYLLQDSPSLMKFGKAVQHYDISICGANAVPQFVKFCKLYEALFDVRIYASTMEDESTTKILNPATNYKKILELENMRSIQSDIAALEVGQERLEQSLFNMRSSLGDHFHQLATFDQDKAEYDVGFLIDKIADFTSRIADSDLKEKLSTLILLVVGANTAELVQLGTQLAAAIAENFNPLKWLAGGGGVQDVLDQANALAQTGVDTAKLVNIGQNVLPQLAEKARELSEAMAGNAEIHTKLNTTFHQLKDKESIDVDTVQANFLVDYRGYDPGWSSADIAMYTVLLKGVIEELCDILYGGDTVASAVVEGIGASEGVCLNIKTNAEVIEAVYNEMYEFQYEFMEAMAVAVRALVNKHSADTVRNLPEEVDDPATYRLQLKFYAYRIKLQSKQHILLALKDVCDVDEFKNGGVPTDKCERALASQSNAAIDRVLGEEVNECPSGQISDIYARIPAKLNPDQVRLEAGTLDLTKLYSGNLTSFRIPFSKSNTWIHNFVSSTLPVHDDVALYLKRFELYLPDLTPSPVSHDITITVKQDGVAKVIQSSGVKYGFASPKVFTLSYGENKHRCMNGFDDSAYPELCAPGPSQVCVVSHGEVSENEMAPPLHGGWLITSSLPGGLPVPKPSAMSIFYLRAALSICVKNPKNIDLDGLGRPNIVQVTPDDKCCPRGQFWYISPFLTSFQKCQDCPERSTPKLGGLYCHDDEADKVSVRGKSKPEKHGVRGKNFRHHKMKAKNEKRKMKKHKKN